MPERLYAVVGVILILAVLAAGVTIYLNHGKVNDILISFPTGYAQADQQLGQSVTSTMVLAAKFYPSDRNLVGRTDETGMTPLHWAAAEDNVGIAKLLLAQKADVDAQDSNGMTPLHLAAQNNSARVAKLLVTYHADPNIQDKDNHPPIYYADEGNLQEVGEVIRAKGGMEE